MENYKFIQNIFSQGSISRDEPKKCLDLQAMWALKQNKIHNVYT
jgi:hypothetical protein